MRLWWNHIWKSRAYRCATARGRRMIEIRYCVARAVKARRRQLQLTQAALARRIGCSRNTVSKMERASNRVALDIGVECLLELGCSDDELAAIFNPLSNQGIVTLRRRAAERAFPKPAAAESPVEHRFYARRRM